MALIIAWVVVNICGKHHEYEYCSGNEKIARGGMLLQLVIIIVLVPNPTPACHCINERH